jgi:predicted ATPase/class 3 adenylate cyclase
MAAGRLDLPTGTVTFFRTDVEGSMRHARALGSRWDELNERQLGIIRRAVADAGGVTVRTEGDAVFAVFSEAAGAIRAAIASQTAIREADWPWDTPLRVRIGLHAGEAHLSGDDYGGFDVNRAARIAGVAHGGQIVVSDPVRALVAADLPTGVGLRDLGEHPLKDVPQPERLFQLDVPGLERDFPPPRTAAPTAGNLPPRLTSFIGRDAEVSELRRLLGEARLVTVWGPGGIGKTSLAIEVARHETAAYPDGVWFVGLDSTSDPAQVPAAIARSLGLYDGPGRPASEGVARFLAERTTLLVLDNFEHLLDAAPEIPPLLRAAAGLRVIVTSRAPLRVAGEQAYPVGPLTGVGSEGAAVQLFEERARSVVPGWSAGPDLPVVEAICRLLDGLPLGIELAAARTGLLPVSMIRDRLASSLPLPGSGPRDLPERQRTLESAIGWSHDLLPPDRRRLLHELGAFEGGFDVDQVRDVAGSTATGDDVLDGLVELADLSLIERDVVAGAAGLGGLRFSLLETIRSFALHALRAEGREDEVRRKHAEAFAALAETAAQHLPSADQGRWLDRLRQDHDNLGAALRWSVAAGDVNLAQRLAASTWRYWQFGGHLREGRELIDAVIAMPGADEPSPSRLWAYAAAGGLAYWQADTDRARDLYQEQLATARQIGDLAGEADACYNLAAVNYIMGDGNEAKAILELARQRYRDVGDELGFNRTEWSVANIMLIEGGTAAGWDPALIESTAAEGMARMIAAKARYEATGDAMYVGLAAGTLAFANLFLGDIAAAGRDAVETIVTAHAMRDVATTTVSLAGGAIIAMESGLSREAATMMGAFDALCEIHGVRPPAGLGQLLAGSRIEQRAEATLDSQEYAAAVRQGRHMSLDEAVAFVVDSLGRSERTEA